MLRKIILSFFLASLCLGNFAPEARAAASVPEEARTIPILHNGRVKAFDAFSRQTLKLVRGSESWDKKEAFAVLFEAMAFPEKVTDYPWIRVDYFELKNELGLSSDSHFFSLKQILPSISKVEVLVRSAKKNRDSDVRPSKLEQKAEQLYTKVRAIQELTSLEAYKVIPSAQNGWEDFQGNGRNSAVFRGILDSYRSKNTGELSSKIRDWKKTVSSEPSVSPSKVSLEVLYYKLKPFEWAAALYLLAFLFFFYAPAKKERGFFFTVLAILFHTLGIALRVYILSRPPVSNMYESMIFMNWALMIYACFFSWTQKNEIALKAGALVSALVMIYGNLLPIDSSLEVLVPVLRSNYWLSIHVMTIVSSYGAFGLAMALGHRQLYLDTVQKLTPKGEEDSSYLIFRVIQLGTLLIGVGTFLGGVWANESWGRFWGWDPKETWALITFLGYLVIVHLKYARKISDFYMAVGSVLGFLLVLMTWYGVNFVLGRGLHSYGAGSGGMQWVIYYLIAETLFLGWVFIKKRR